MLAKQALDAFFIQKSKKQRLFWLLRNRMQKNPSHRNALAKVKKGGTGLVVQQALACGGVRGDPPLCKGNSYKGRKKPDKQSSPTLT